MKFTAIPSDGVVYIDEKAYPVRMDDLPYYVHAIQWDGQQGHIEFVPDDKGSRMPNVTFSDLTPYKFLVDRWNQKNEEEERKQKQADDARRAQVKEIQANTRRMK